MRLRLPALTLTCLLLLPLAGAQEASPELERVRLQLKWRHQFQFAGYYAAVQQGFYADEGLQVELVENSSPDAGFHAVLDGRAEYGVGDASIVMRALDGAPVTVLTQIMQRSPLVYLSLASSGITSPYELPGKRVMADEATHQLAPMLAMIDSLLGDQAEVELFPHTYNIDDLIDGRVDVISAYITNEPFVFRERGVAVNIISPANYGVDYYGDNLFTTRKEAEERPDRVDRMIRATLKGWRHALDHPEEIIDLILTQYSPSANREKLRYEARMIGTLIGDEIVPLGTLDPGRYRGLIRYLRGAGSPGQTQLPEGFIYGQQERDRLLPGLTDGERAFLRQHAEITVAAYHEGAPYGFVDESGNYVGVIPDILEVIGGVLGVTFLYEPLEYEALLAEVEGGTADVTTLNDPMDMPYEEHYLRTEDFLFLPYALYVRQNGRTAPHPNEASGLTIALCEGWDLENPSLEVLAGNRFVFGPSMLDCLNMVLRGEADAFFDVHSEIQYLLDKHSIRGVTPLRAYNEGYPAAFFVRKDWPELHSVLNKALRSVSKHERIQYLRKWNAYLDDPVYRFVSVELNREERDWVQSRPVLRVALPENWPPISSQKDGGQLEGIAIDYAAVLGQLLGVELDLIGAGADRPSELVTQGRADLALVTGMSGGSRETFFTTRPWLSSRVVILNRDEDPLLTGLDDLAGSRLAVPRNLGLISRVRADHPDILIVETDTVHEALNLVHRREADACLSGIYAAGQLVTELGLVDLRVAGDSPYDVETRLAYSASEPLLGSMVQKALDAIPEEQREAIHKKWISIRVEQPYDFTLIWQGGAAGLAFLGFLFFWNRYLARQIALRTADLRQALEAMRETDRRLKAIFNQAYQLIGFLAPDGTLLEVNETALRFAGVKERDICGKRLWESPWWAHDPEAQARIRDAVARAARGEFLRFETQEQDADGQLHLVDLSIKPIFDENGEVIHLLAEGRDITEFRKAQEAFAESQERYRILFNTAGDGIMILKDGLFVDCNARVCEMFACSRADIMGRHPGELSPPVQPDGRATMESAQERIAAVLDGTPQLFEWMHQRLDGTQFEAEVSLNAVTLNEGIFVQAFVRDISARKRAEEKHEALEAQLRQAQKMEAIGTLAGGIAHDFNNLLQVIQGGLEIAYDDIEAANPARECLDEVRNAADRAGALVRQLLTFSRRSTSELNTLDLNEVVSGLMKMLRRVIGEHVELSIRPGAALAPVLADQGEMEQILMNLCVNARDAMPEGGKILIETANVTVEEEYCERVPDARPGEYVLLNVSDTGTGMSKEVQDRIFEPFFTTKSVGKGTGLGLATVYAIAKRHRGFLGVYSEPGHGTAMHVYLPVERTEAEDRAGIVSTPSRGGTPAPGGDETILLAEDDPQVRDLGVRLLTRAGYRVVEAEDGAQAMQRFDDCRDQIALAVLDVMMPRHSGREVHDHIRRVRPELPIVFASGYSFDVLGPQFLPDPEAKLIKKPFSRNDLLRVIRDMIDSSRSR